MIRFCFFMVILLVGSFCQAQIQTLGNNPSDIPWKVIKTSAANIIYEDGMDVEAQRIANIIEYMDENSRRSIGDTKRKIDLLVQNHTVIPNGYVALAPFRSEFYATPPQQSNLLGSMDWLDALAVHEYRHALQFMNMKRGLGKFAYLIAGDTGLAVTSGLAIPNWYFEGDAVITETSMSNAGRGRTPDFTKGQRALAQEGINYSYMKSRNGSYKDFVPDHYRLGYMMLSYLRNEYGNDISGDIAREGSSWKRIIYPFSRSLHHYTGLNTYNLYWDSWTANKVRWQEQLEATRTDSYDRLTDEPRTFTNYLFPQNGENGVLYAVKESFRETSAIVQLEPDGSEQHIVDMGVNIDNYFDWQAGTFVWTEFSTDGRRSNESFSNIFLYENGEKRPLTSKGKYFSPIINGDEIWATYQNELQISHIDILDKKSGTLKRRISFDKGAFVTRLSAINDHEVAYLLKRNNQLYIEKMDLKSDQTKLLFGSTQHTIDGLEYAAGRLYFSSSLSGIDNIYSIDAVNGRDLKQITSVQIAAGDPDVSADGKMLVFNQFNTKGKYLSNAAISDELLGIQFFKEPVEMQWQDRIAAKEEGGNILDRVPTQQFESEAYTGLFRGMRLHSWGIAGSTISPGIRLVANNILDDVSLVGSVQYNRNEQQTAFDLNFRIARYFPVLDFALNRSGRSGFTIYNDMQERVSFTETSGRFGIQIPWNKLDGNFRSSARIGVSSELAYQNGLKLVQDPEIRLDNRTVLKGTLFTNYSRKRRMASQNLRPKKGFDVGASYQYQFLNRLQSRIVVTSGVNFPGLSPNHSLYVSAGYRIQNNNGMINPFVDDFLYTRGLETPGIYQQAGRFSLDYAFPLFYPDWGFAGLVYFKRVKFNAFYDAGIMRIEGSDFDNMHVVGGELLFDNNYLNLLTVPLGIQVGYVTSSTVERDNPLFIRFISQANF